MNEFFILFIGPTTDQKYVVTIRDAYGKYCSNQKMASLLDTTLKKIFSIINLIWNL